MSTKTNWRVTMSLFEDVHYMVGCKSPEYGLYCIMVRYHGKYGIGVITPGGNDIMLEGTYYSREHAVDAMRKLNLNLSQSPFVR